MDITEQDQPDMDFEETLSEQSGHPDSPDSSDTFGEPELFPRVGDEYQAVIPALLTPSEWLEYFSNPCDSQALTDASHDFLLGLPVPIRLAYNETKTIKEEGIEVHDDVDCAKMDSKQCVTECISAPDKKEPSSNGDCVNQRCVANDYVIVPGLPEDSWSDFAVECFLLGLYFFGKNLLLVKKFMESKTMGQILSFYYGRFYRSAKYQPWADCRKIKGRKCIIGQRIITGSRQQELLSRLLPHFSEASRNASVEAYKAFMEGRTSLEEYVFTLKSMVGIRALVEAVRIGKKKEDLTVMAMESSRTNNTLSSRPERPSSKACSDLTFEEIVKYLTGDFRMSKARSSDLFWEAIWPRLLAKGWHSEKPNDEAYRGIRDPLVFLLPGIKKFKRKLSKGDHYFDSVSDVLKMVASDPELLVLETEENGNRTFVTKNESGTGSEPTSEEDGGSDPEHQRYLKPRFSSDTPTHMKFTIVDTSLCHEDEPFKVREMRSLPAEMKTSGDAGSDRLKEYPLKRRRLMACSKAEKKAGVRRRRLPDSARRDTYVLSLPARSKKTGPKIHFRVQTHDGVSPTNSLVANGHGKKSGKEESAEGSCSLATSSHGQSLQLIDLNVSQFPDEPEANGELMKVKVEEGNDWGQNSGMDVNVESSEQVVRMTNDDTYKEEHGDGNGRRHSRRVRPLSTRALEALESSFMSPKVGRKRLHAADAQDEKPKVSRRARTKTSVPAGNCTVDAVRDLDAMRGDEIHSAAATEVLGDALS